MKELESASWSKSLGMKGANTFAETGGNINSATTITGAN